jgi:ribonuclease HI
MIRIHTDGACLDNPGPGGWAYIIDRDGVRTEARGAVPTRTTNNRMEILAAIEALSSLTEPSEVTIVSDSEYLVYGYTLWMPVWKTHSPWRTASGKPVSNKDLWDRLDALCSLHRVSWLTVRGHSGSPDNERCDFLANQEAGITPGYKPRWQVAKEKKRLERQRAFAEMDARIRAGIAARGVEQVAYRH